MACSELDGAGPGDAVHPRAWGCLALCPCRSSAANGRPRFFLLPARRRFVVRVSTGEQTAVDEHTLKRRFEMFELSGSALTLAFHAPAFISSASVLALRSGCSGERIIPSPSWRRGCPDEP